jgi:hypothetical protein
MPRMARPTPRAPRSAAPRLVWRDGLHLEGTLLWLDAARRHHVSFLSHARVPIGRAGRVLATPATAALAGISDARAPLLCDYGRRLKLGPLAIELAPSGQMLGAAQAIVHTAEGRLVYARDLCPTDLPTAAPLALRSAEALVVGAAAAGWGVTLPTRADALRELTRCLEEALANGESPVVLAVDPGPAQDLLIELARFRMRVHRAIAGHARAYTRLGAGTLVRVPPIFRGSLARGEVLLWPAAARFSRGLRAIERPRFVFASSWASEPAIASRMRCAHAVALPDRADAAGLCAYARTIGVSQAIVVGGSLAAAVELPAAVARAVRPVLAQTAAQLAGRLVREGLRARALAGPQQMSLFA